MTVTSEAPARRHMASPVVLAETKYGDIELTITGPDRIYAHTSHHYTGRCPIIDVRNVQYTIGVHVQKDGDTWRILGDTPYEQYEYTTLHRTDNRGEASRAARRAVASEVVTTVNRVIPMVPELLRDAELANLNNELMTLDREIREAREKLVALNNKAGEKRAREALLQMEQPR